MTHKTKAADLGAGEAAHNITISPKFKHTRRVLQAVIALVLHGLWTLDYTIEDARQRYAMRRDGGA